jgi:hypothetical protein
VLKSSRDVYILSTFGRGNTRASIRGGRRKVIIAGLEWKRTLVVDPRQYIRVAVSATENWGVDHICQDHNVSRVKAGGGGNVYLY